MPKLSSLATDQSKELKGVWAPFNGIELLIARLGNKEYTKFVRKLGKAHKMTIKYNANDEKSQEEMESLSKEAIAYKIVLDWRNVQDEETGKDIPYDPEIMHNYLKQPEMRDLFLFIIEVANDREYYTKELEDEEKGKS